MGRNRVHPLNELEKSFGLIGYILTDTVSPPGGPNVSVSIQVISDQPIVVGSTLAGQTSGHCSLLPK